jgi:glycine oxidase
MRSESVGIAGAGILGRLMALVLMQEGYAVTLFDKGTDAGSESCSFVGAGMLSPCVELENSDLLIFELGVLSLELWPQILRRLEGEIYYRETGTLVVAHPKDAHELSHIYSKITRNISDHSSCKVLSHDEISSLESELSDKFQSALYFPREAHVGTRHLLKTLGRHLMDHEVFKVNTQVNNVGPTYIETAQGQVEFDWILDCRGMGSKKQLNNLRGVRGEIITVHAPEVNISRVIRCPHPRYPVYIVPRPNQVYLIGATLIESESMAPITVQSTLELLSAAYSVHSGFSEASVLETAVHCRPAFNDNNPQIEIKNNLISVNGLYRHGYLISPALVHLVLGILQGQKVPEKFKMIVKHQEVA